MPDGSRLGLRQTICALLCGVIFAVAPLPGVTASAASSPTDRSSPSAEPTTGASSGVRLKPAARRIAVLRNQRIVNPTGMAVSLLHKNVIWLISGRRLFAINTAGETVAVYTLDGFKPQSLKAMAIRKEEDGTSTLLLGDFGDPARRRAGVWLYAVPEPKTLADGKLRASRWLLSYPDGAQDAGTLLLDPYDQRAYVVTVSPTGGKLYAIPSVLGPGMRNRMAVVRPLYFVAQDGFILADGRVVLRGGLQSHVLDGVKGRRLAFLQMPAGTEYGPIALGADGKSMLTVGRQRNAALWRVALPDEPKGTARRGEEWSSTRVPDMKIDSPGRLPGGVLGTVSLGALVVLGGAGLVVMRRRRNAV